VSISLESFVTWLAVFARIGAILALLPMFAPQNFPVQLRVALSALVAMVLCPFLPLIPAETHSMWRLVRLMAAEISVGLLLGFICRLVFTALEAAGNLMATEMGLMMSAEFNQFSNTTESVPGVILHWMALMLWFSMDLHHWLIAALQRSYSLVPVGGAHLSEFLLHDVIHRTAGIFVVAIQISAPIIGVSFIISLVFSMLGRAVPQMNVFAESFPVRTLVGLSLFGATCLFMAQHIANYLRHLPEDALRVAQLVGGG
jgi:flagellar biosynthetic protein FliR